MLTTIGRKVLHTGPLGSASVLKVATNYLAGVHLIATGEALMVAKKAGIDLGVAYEAIRISSGNSFTHETEGQLILNGSYAVDFTMDLELKDLGLFQSLAEQHQVPLELSPLAVDIVADALNRYGPRAWSTQVVKRLEDDCDTELRAPGFPEILTDMKARARATRCCPGAKSRQARHRGGHVLSEPIGESAITSVRLPPVPTSNMTPQGA